MANDFVSGYFGGKEKEEVQIPTGGEGFPRMGFIGPVDIVTAYRLWTRADVTSEEFKQSIPQPDFRRETSTGSFFNYYGDSDVAKVAAKELVCEIGPQLFWFFKVPTAEILNTANRERLLEGFGASVTCETRIMTYRSKTYRHEFHLITMPALVAAVAKAEGYDTPGFPIDELIVNDVIVNDAFQETMIGDTSGMNWTDSVLGRRRVELWKALGEDDPAKYTIRPDDRGKVKFVTEAPKLLNCLQLVHNKLPEPLWGRFILATDPSVDAGFEKKDGEWTPGNLPALTEVFKGKEKAIEAAQEDLKKLEEAGVSVNDPAVQTNAGEPALPERWEGMRDTFVEMLILPLLGKDDEEVEKIVKTESQKYTCEADVAIAWRDWIEKDNK